jgi:hypothetical protein
VAGEVISPAAISRKTVVVRTADGRIFGLAIEDGKRRWVFQRPMPSLLLRSESGVKAIDQNVIAGFANGKMLALDIEDGTLVWEVTVAQPRGATDLERIADVAGLPIVDGANVCAAAFQAKVACFEIQSRNQLWSRDMYTALPKGIIPHEPFARFVVSGAAASTPLGGLRVGIPGDFMVKIVRNDEAISNQIDREIKTILRDQLGAELVESTDPAHEVFTTEYFGPILGVHVYADDSFADAVAQAESVSPYALTGSIFATDRSVVDWAASALRDAAGNFYINDKPTGAVVGQQPFGGARGSGTNDKAGSVLNLHRWLSPRTIKETFEAPTSWQYPHMG